MFCRAAAHLSLAAILGAAGAGAQVDVGAGPNTLEFSFSNPRARSMGFGEAFVALADDALRSMPSDGSRASRTPG